MSPASAESGAAESQLAPAFVTLATVLAGAQPLAERGVNDSFRGQLLLASGAIKPAIIKDLETKELANELMVAALADAAGMPIPGAHLAMAPPAALAAKKGPAMSDGSRLVFASVDAQTPAVAQLYSGQDATVQRRVRERLAEWDGVGDLYGFDSWVANIDRHERNLLFSGDKEVWLIDHGHCFTGPKWTAAGLEPGKLYRNKLKGWLTPVMSDRQRSASVLAATAFEARIKELDLRKVAELNHVLGVLDGGDFDALILFLATRKAHVHRLAADALNLVV